MERRILFLAAVAFVAGALIAACSRSHNQPATRTAAPASPAATASVFAESVDGVPLVTMTLDKNEPFPMGAVFYVEGGCIQCDGPATSLDRVYKDQAGTLHADPLFELSNPTGPTNITGIATTEDGHGIAIGIVHWPSTPKDGSPTIPDPTTSIEQSLDGGITWADLGSLQGLASPVEVQTIADTGYTLVRRVLGANSATPSVDFITMPGAKPNAVGVGLDPTSPIVTFGYGGPSLVLADGQSLISYGGGSQPDVSTKLPAGGRIVAAGPQPLSLNWTALFTLGDTNPQLPTGSYVAMVPERIGPPSTIYAWPHDASVYYWSGAWLAPDQAVMQTSVPKGSVGEQSSAFDDLGIPAIIDFQTNTVRPIAEYFADRAAKGDRSEVIAIGRGPVVKVQGASDCLNVRSAPSMSANLLGCYKDGVLLPDHGQTRVIDGTAWLAVKSPGGQLGWASAQYLDTAGRDLSENPKTYPTGTRTGNAEVDPVLAAIDSGEPAQILAATEFTTTPCTTTTPGGIGPVAACPPGVADGTPVQGIGGSGCEGYFADRRNYEDNLGQLASFSGELYAIAKLKPPANSTASDGGFLLVYANPWPSMTAGYGLLVRAGKIEATSSGCAETPQGFLDERFSGVIDSIVLPPR